MFYGLSPPAAAAAAAAAAARAWNVVTL